MRWSYHLSGTCVFFLALSRWTTIFWVNKRKLVAVYKHRQSDCAFIRIQWRKLDGFRSNENLRLEFFSFEVGIPPCLYHSFEYMRRKDEIDLFRVWISQWKTWIMDGDTLIISLIWNLCSFVHLFNGDVFRCANIFDIIRCFELMRRPRQRLKIHCWVCCSFWNISFISFCLLNNGVFDCANTLHIIRCLISTRRCQ